MKLTDYAVDKDNEFKVCELIIFRWFPVQQDRIRCDTGY